MIRISSVVAVALTLSTLPETPAFAADTPRMKGIGWVVIRSHDRDRLEAFYRALGFQEWASSERIIGLRAGAGAAIELGHLDPDAPKNPPRTSRDQAPAMVIFGTDNVAEVVARAEAKGASFIEPYDSPANILLVYIGDPDGNVIGFAQDGPMWGNTEELEVLGIETTPEQ
jgi:catechol 2,3-dioxygenase-like lactoylglutathione lyase family enzyme